MHHLQIDGWVSTVLPRDVCELTVMNLIDLINMKPLKDFIYSDTYLGPSFYQLIMQSHVCGDYFKLPQGMFLTLDIFSCMWFPKDVVLEYCQQQFHFKKITRKRSLLRPFGEATFWQKLFSWIR